MEVVCPGCGALNRYPADAAGRTEVCEVCHAHLDVPSPLEDSTVLRLGNDLPSDDLEDATQTDGPRQGKSIVLLCPFCDEHAGFDASAAGTTQTCPHCGEELDVLGSLVGEAVADSVIFFRCDWCKRVARTDADGLTRGCRCPHCGEENDPAHLANNRLTSGQAERLGLLESDGDEDV